MIPYDKREGKIWYNNDLVDWQDVKLHVLSHGLHFASVVLCCCLALFAPHFASPHLPSAALVTWVSVVVEAAETCVVAPTIDSATKAATEVIEFNLFILKFLLNQFGVLYLGTCY